MKKFFLVLVPFILFSAYKENTGTYNMLIPRIFSKGVISTEKDEFGATFTPDGKICYFSLKSPSTINSHIAVICFSEFRNDQWNEPEIAAFSGTYADFNPVISPDGNKLFFISNRPLPGKKRADTNIWKVEKTSRGWTEPAPLSDLINTSGWELGCSVSSDGTLYFSTTGISGNPDLYRSRFREGKYQAPESLGKEINTTAAETDPFIAPDQSYILFASSGRTDAMSDSGASVSYPRSDLYISYFKNGQWTEAKNLGREINSNADESNPWVSHDGRTIYFTSERNFVTIPMKQKLDYASLENQLHGCSNGLGDIYMADTHSFLHK
jgi:Tol biopolymer transport system component